jgi:hypothetical protein
MIPEKRWLYAGDAAKRSSLLMISVATKTSIAAATE